MNMCSVRQRPMPWAPNSRAFAASSGVSAFARTLSRRMSSAQPRIVSKSSLICGGTSGTAPRMTRPVPPSIVSRSPSPRSWPFERRLLRLDVHRERLAARDARLAHPARDDCRVRRHAAVGREDPLRGDHPVDVVRGRLPADEDDVVAVRAALGGRVGVEHDLPGRGAGRRVQALRDHVDARGRVDHRMQELVELPGVDAHDGVLARDQSLLDHVDGRLQRGCGGALRAPRLEQVEPSVLDGELDVLHVAVVLLEPAHRLGELLERVREHLLHLGDVLGRADPRDDVLALRVGQELAVEPRLTGRGIAREGDAGSRLLALVAEDHLHDVDRRAEVVGDVVRAPVDLRPGSLPRIEDGSNGPRELVPGVLRERRAGLAFVRRPCRSRPARPGPWRTGRRPATRSGRSSTWPASPRRRGRGFLRRPRRTSGSGAGRSRWRSAGCRCALRARGPRRRSGRG